MSPHPTLPPAARAIAHRVTEAVDSARSPDLDPDRFATAVARLAALDPEQVHRVLSAVLRPLLEDLHPDGLTGDDLRSVIDGCLRRTTGRASEQPSGRAAAPVSRRTTGGASQQPSGQASVDPQLLGVVLAGAFGVHPDDDDRPDGISADVLRHACLLLADLLAVSGARLDRYLASAFAEIARSETHDDA